MFHWIQYLFTGLIVGAIARFVLPGADHMGLVLTTCVGIGGSLVGGLISRMFGKPAPDAKFHPAGFFLSLVGAIALLIVVRMMRHA